MNLPRLHQNNIILHIHIKLTVYSLAELAGWPVSGTYLSQWPIKYYFLKNSKLLKDRPCKHFVPAFDEENKVSNFDMLNISLIHSVILFSTISTTFISLNSMSISQFNSY